MAIDVTPGGVSANSYLSVADADLYAAADLGEFARRWADAATTNDLKERALKRATADIDTYIGSTAARWDDAQMLAFPRWSDIDDNDQPFIPWRLRRATYEQAAYVLVNADVIDQAATRRARALSNWTEPNVSGSLITDPTFGRLSPKVVQLLSEAGFEGGAVVGWIETT